MLFRLPAKTAETYYGGNINPVETYLLAQSKQQLQQKLKEER